MKKFFINKKLKLHTIICLAFITYICFYALMFFCSWFNSKEPSVRKASNSYFDNISFKQSYIDIYGFTQKTLGKRQIENFTIFKNEYGKLVSPRAEISEQIIEQKLDEMMPIFQLLTEDDSSTKYIYLTNLLPIPNKEELPIGVDDATRENAEKLMRHLKNRDINVLDLRSAKQIKAIPEEERFYLSDHHWSNESVFATYQTIIEYLNENSILEENLTVYTDSDFEEIRQKNTFLGSYGVKVGEYYGGKDDFVFYTPTFDTDFEFYAYDAKGNLTKEKFGDWETALMDREKLLDPEYKNKYYAFLNMSQIESRIINKKAENQIKLLVISHSYGRPLCQYLALNFAEVRNLDPQKGRFQGNYIEYIEDYDPDYVIILTEFEGEIIGNYRTTDQEEE